MSLYSAALGFLQSFSIVFISFLKCIILFIIFQISFSCLPVFSYILFSYFKRLFWTLCQANLRSPLLCIGNWWCHFSWFFMIYVAFHVCLCTWKCHFPCQAFLPAFSRYRPSPILGLVGLPLECSYTELVLVMRLSPGWQWDAYMMSLLSVTRVGMDPVWSLGRWAYLQYLVQYSGWNVGLIWGPRLGLLTTSLLPGVWSVWLLPGYWESCYLVTGWVPAWARLAQDHHWQCLEWSLRAIWGSTANTEVLRPASGAIDGCTFWQVLECRGWSLTMARGVRFEYRAFSGFPEVQMCLPPIDHSMNHFKTSL